MSVTVDASVAVKWFVPEPRHEEARLLSDPDIERHAPTFLVIECANALWKKAQRGEIADLTPYLEEILNLPEALAFHSTRDLLARAGQLAAALGHPVYDCLYLACAEATDSALVTDDRRLGRVARERLPKLEVWSLQDLVMIRRLESGTHPHTP